MFRLQGSFERNGLMFEKSTKISVVTGSRSISVGDRAITKFDPDRYLLEIELSQNLILILAITFYWQMMKMRGIMISDDSNEYGH